jgi:hypothetical protein
VTDRLADIEEEWQWQFLEDEKRYYDPTPKHVYEAIMWLVAEVKGLRIAEQRRTEELQTAMAEVERLQDKNDWLLDELHDCETAREGESDAQALMELKIRDFEKTIKWLVTRVEQLQQGIREMLHSGHMTTTDFDGRITCDTCNGAP